MAFQGSVGRPADTKPCKCPEVDGGLLADYVMVFPSTLSFR